MTHVYVTTPVPSELYISQTISIFFLQTVSTPYIPSRNFLRTNFEAYHVDFTLFLQAKQTTQVFRTSKSCRHMNLFK